MALAAREDLEALVESDESFARALAMREDFQAARLNRAGVLMRLGRLPEAIAAYRDWLTRAPQDDADRRAVERQIATAESLERAVREALPDGTSEPGGDGR